MSDLSLVLDLVKSINGIEGKHFETSLIHDIDKVVACWVPKIAKVPKPLILQELEEKLPPKWILIADLNFYYSIKTHDYTNKEKEKIILNWWKTASCLDEYRQLTLNISASQEPFYLYPTYKTLPEKIGHHVVCLVKLR